MVSGSARIRPGDPPDSVGTNLSASCDVASTEANLIFERIAEQL
jgi:hypothetical protein